MNYFKEEYGSPELYYERFYAQSRGYNSSTLMRLLSSYPHKLIEKRFKSNAGLKILELGFGRGEYLEFVKQDFDRYVGLDIRSFKDSSIDLIKNFEFLEGNATKLEIENSSFDRVIATCLLSHLKEPENALLEWRRVIKNGGVMVIYLPTEPGLGLRLFRVLVSKRWATKNGFQGYDLYIAREHIYSFQILKTLIKEIFQGSKIKFQMRPLPFFGWYLNLFCVVVIEVQK